MYNVAFHVTYIYIYFDVRLSRHIRQIHRYNIIHLSNVFSYMHISIYKNYYNFINCC